MPVLSLGIDIRGLKTGAAQAANSLDAAAAATDTLSESMTRAAKQALALVGAYKTIGAMKDFIRRGIEFNSSIESSRIGIASLITAMVKLEDAQGNVLEGAEKYKAAQGLAAEMMQEIQRLGLETTATTQELVQGVQSVMGPAVQAGLALKEIPQFAVAAAQAMQTMGIPLEQMRTEIEALLTGNINKAQDLLAPRLGIDRETIESWKAQGTLVENLMEKLEAFQLAGQDVAQTWKGLTSNLAEAMDVLAGQSASGMSESLKKAVREVQELVIQTNNGTVGISSNFQNIADLLISIEDSIGSGILAATEKLVSLAKDFNNYLGDNGVEQTLDDLGTAITSAGFALAGLTISRKAYNSEALQSVKADVQAQGVLGALATKIVQADTALQNKIATDKKAALSAIQNAEAMKASALAAEQEAKAAYEAAQQEVLRQASKQKAAMNLVTSLADTNQATRANELLSASEKRLAQAYAERNAAALKLSQATSAVASSSTKIDIARANFDKLSSTIRMTTLASSGLKSAFSGLLSVFGGPWGLAITAGTAALGYFITKQSEAEKYAQSHAEALRAVSEDLNEAADATDRYAEKLKGMTSNQLAYEALSVKNELDKILNDYDGFAENLLDISRRLNPFNNIIYERIYGDSTGIERKIRSIFLSASSTIEDIKKLEEILKPLRDIDNATSDQLKVLREQLLEYSISTKKIEEYREATENNLDSIISSKFELEQITQTQKEFSGTLEQGAGVTSQAANATDNLTSAMAALNEASQQQPKNVEESIQWLVKRTSQSDTMRKTLEEEAKGYDTVALSLLNLTAIQASASGKTQEAQELFSKVADFQKALADVYAGRTGKSGISSGLSDATRKAEEAKRALEDLELQTNRLTMTDEQFREWELTTKTLPELIAKTNGATDAVNKFADAQRKAWAEEEKEKALEDERRNLEEQIDFYKELGELTGKYNKFTELQNDLIKEQAEAFRRTGAIADEYITEWEKLQKISISVNPFDGAYRGLLQFTSEYADEASQWESISYGFASDFESATRDMFDEFLSTGRMSFDSLADAFAATLKNMAYQALVQPVVVSVVQSAAGALYGSTSADGGAGAGSAAGGGLVQSTAGALQNYAAGQVFKGGTSFLPESISSGISGILSTPLPGTTIPGLMGPTASGAALGGGLTISSALGYGGFGSLGYGLLGGALGLPQNQYTGITSGLGGALGAWGASAALGGTALGASLGSVVPVVGTAIGALVGGLLGGLFGKKRKPRWGTDYSVNLWESATAAGQEQEYMAPDGKVRWKTAAGLSVASAAKNGAPDELENIGVDAVYDLLHAMQVQSGKIADMLGGVNAGMETAYLEALKAGGAFAGSRWLKGGDITEENFRKYLEDIQAEAMGRMASAMATIDLRPLTVAADGMAADTVDELSGALKSAFDYYDFGAQLFTDDALTEFQAGAREQIEKAFADLDMSSLRVDFDQSSFAGLQQAYAAMQAWEQVTEGLESILNPASELEAAMSAATVQFDSWIDSLRSLGWQEEAIAEIEAKRAQYLNEYAMAAMRATEQDLNLRAMALQYGSNSDAYGLQSLQYQQQNELEELARKFGKDSGIYQSAVEIQQAELAQYRVEQLQAELETALAAQQQAAQQETQNRINALNSQAAALRESVSEAERMRDALEDIAEALGDARRDLWASDEDNPLGTSYQEALAAFEDAYLKGVAGDQDSLNELPALASDLLTQGRDSLATSQEYTDLFYDVDRKLADAQKYATEQYDAQTAIADGLAAQLEAITGQTDTLQAAINAGTAATEYTGRSVEAIKAELELVKALLEQEKADVSSGASLSQTEALIQAKVDQLNAIAYSGRTDWTAESFLAEMYKQGLSLPEWYDKYGRNENLGVTFDVDAAWQQMLANKAAILNAGDSDGGWTAEKVAEAIAEAGMSLNEWYVKYGLAEGVGTYYKEYSQDAADSTNNVLDQMLADMDDDTKAQLEASDLLGSIMGSQGSKLAAYLQAINSGISGLDWSVTVNVSSGSGTTGSTNESTTTGSVGGAAGGTGNTSSLPDSNGRLPTPTGVFGSYYQTENDLLAAKANSLNKSGYYENLPTGYTHWTILAVQKAIANDGMTTSEWYELFGKAEGFASGGITPINKPFWVGEQGPELMMSPKQWGVLNNSDSVNLANIDNIGKFDIKPIIEENTKDIAYEQVIYELQQVKIYLQNILGKTVENVGELTKVRKIQQKWDNIGVPFQTEETTQEFSLPAFAR